MFNNSCLYLLIGVFSSGSAYMDLLAVTKAAASYRNPPVKCGETCSLAFYRFGDKCSLGGKLRKKYTGEGVVPHGTQGGF